MKITNDKNIQEWGKHADFVIGKFTDEGDFYREHVLNPALLSLLGNIKGKFILDAGSGQGYLSRMLARLGAKVTAIEPAKGLVEYAQQKEEKEKLGITYIQEDLSTWEGKENSFDIVVSNMVFMDIPDWEAAIKNCIKVLKPNGLFVFSISHPCFEYVQKDREHTKEFRHAPNWEDQPFVKVEEYFEEFTVRNFIGYSFHHTLSTYINFLIENGCCLEKLFEPQLAEVLAKKFPHHERDFHVPSFLIVKAVKN